MDPLTVDPFGGSGGGGAQGLQPWVWKWWNQRICHRVTDLLHGLVVVAVVAAVKVHNLHPQELVVMDLRTSVYAYGPTNPVTTMLVVAVVVADNNPGAPVAGLVVLVAVELAFNRTNW